MKRLTSIATLVLICAPVASQCADLRATTYRYDGGDATYLMLPGQHVICDDCPTPPGLVAAPPPQAVRFTPPPAPLPMEQMQEEPAPPVVEHKAPKTLQIVVYFNFNSSTLVPTEKMRIRKALAEKAGSPFAVTVDAYTCRIGSRRYNKGLSVRRAKAVAAYLKSLGVPVADAEGLGIKPLGGPLAKDRRAKIIVRERNYIP